MSDRVMSLKLEIEGVMFRTDGQRNKNLMSHTMKLEGRVVDARRRAEVTDH